jgi:RNA recognition motif-containing protein
MARNKLYVGNLNYTVTSDQLRELFASHGEVQEVTVIDNRGFGFVEMSSQEEADKATEALDGTDFEGRTLRISEARERQPSRGGPRGKGGFKGGQKRGGGQGGRGGGGRGGGGWGRY